VLCPVKIEHLLVHTKKRKIIYVLKNNKILVTELLDRVTYISNEICIFGKNAFSKCFEFIF